MSRRLLDMMAFVAERSGDRTHPAGCMAVTGATDEPDGITWPLLINLCPHEHPRTNTELTKQYADNGWVNIDA